MKRNIFFFLVFSFCGFFAEAQDIHFTQYYTSPCNLNPALTGFFNGSQRFTLQNRTQWRSVTTPFKTLSASFDLPLQKRYLKQDIFGGGIVVNRDQAGDSKFGTTQIGLSLSYIKALTRFNNQFISIGIQGGPAQKTIDYTNLVFDSQYDGSSFNPALPNNEQFPKSNLIYFDLSGGVYWHYIRHRDLVFNGGVALFHINQPKQSLFDNANIRLDRKLLIHASTQFEPKKKMQMSPSILFMRQGTYNEVDIGVMFKLIKVPTEANYLALNFGLFSRIGDALNFIAGLDYKDVSLGISYDVNTSGLVPASNSRGGFEISLTYLMNKNKKVYVKKIPCPIF